ncbi:hypothetical protein [Brevibacillus massiliensis]|nr:hypothetical protein [Brevibacillus massiliensis]
MKEFDFSFQSSIDEQMVQNIRGGSSC